MQRADSLEKILMLGKVEGKRRGWQRVRWADGILDSTDMNSSNLWKTVSDRRAGVLQSMGTQRVDTSEPLSNDSSFSCIVLSRFNRV